MGDVTEQHMFFILIFTNIYIYVAICGYIKYYIYIYISVIWWDSTDKNKTYLEILLSPKQGPSEFIVDPNT